MATDMSAKAAAAELNARISKTIAEYATKPWMLSYDPFQVTDNLYFVGNSWVSAYLIKTSEGLVLIDTTFTETFYQVIDNIYRLGFNPRDIKYCFLSHAHFDHFDAAASLQKMCDCKVYIGADDLFFFQGRDDLTLSPVYYRGDDIRFDGFYDYSRPWTMGDVTFRFFHSPGHTPGTTTFFIDDTHNGQPVTCAMHGGLGINGMTLEELEEKRLPATLQRAFYDSLLELRELKVDIVIPSHNTAMASKSSDSSLLVRYEKADGSRDGLIDTALWRQYLSGQVTAVEAILGK